MWSALTSLFKKQPPAIDFSSLAVDMHSHLIAGIDDGVKNTAQALEVLKSLRSIGYLKVITTPHVMADYYRNTPQIILKGLEDLRQVVAENGLDIEIQAAAEYYLDDGFTMLLDQGQVLTFGQNHLLFELSFINKPSILETVVFKMRTQTYQPILAHPERYSYFHEGSSLEAYARLRELGLLFQLNLGSFAGAYGDEVKKTARQLSEAGMVDFLGSDIHGPAHLPMMQTVRTDKYVQSLLRSGNLKNREL